MLNFPITGPEVAEPRFDDKGMFMDKPPLSNVNGFLVDGVRSLTYKFLASLKPKARKMVNVKFIRDCQFSRDGKTVQSYKSGDIVEGITDAQANNLIKGDLAQEIKAGSPPALETKGALEPKGKGK